MSDAPKRSLDPFRTGLLIALLIVSTATLLVALGKLTQREPLSRTEIESLVDERVDERLRDARPRRALPPSRTGPADRHDSEVFVVVEQMPELIGGLATIQQNLRYPENEC